MGYSGVPGMAASGLQPEVLLWLPLASGLPDRHRVPVALFIGVVATGGLALLGYRIRTADPDPTDDREITAKLERRDLMEGGDPNNTMEWIIQVANRPVTYAVSLTALVGLSLVALALGWGAGLGVLLFGTALVAIQTFLRLGWPYVESFYERRQPDEQEADSLRFQGFSRDTMTFLTIVIALFVATMGLIALESIVL